MKIYHLISKSFQLSYEFSYSCIFIVVLKISIVQISEWISFFSTTMCLFCIYHRPCLSIIDKKFYGKSNSIFFCNHNSNEITFYCCRPIISSHCGFNGNNNRIFAEQNIYKSNFINNKNAMECGFILFLLMGKRH